MACSVPLRRLRLPAPRLAWRLSLEGKPPDKGGLLRQRNGTKFSRPSAAVALHPREVCRVSRCIRKEPSSFAPAQFLATCSVNSPGRLVLTLEAASHFVPDLLVSPFSSVAFFPGRGRAFEYRGLGDASSFSPYTPLGRSILLADLFVGRWTWAWTCSLFVENTQYARVASFHILPLICVPNPPRARYVPPAPKRQRTHAAV